MSEIHHQTIRALSENPAGLENYYRELQVQGQALVFREALRQSASANPQAILLQAWMHRLNVDLHAQPARSLSSRQWLPTMVASLVVGTLMSVLAQGQAPVPFLAETSLLFRVGCGPLLALGILAYLAWGRPSKPNLIRCALSATALCGLCGYIYYSGDAADSDATLLSISHLIFLSWVAIGAAACLGNEQPARQAYAFLIKSIETLLTAAIYVAATAMFVGLTYGIFAVLGVELSEDNLTVLAGFGFGAIPILALGSVYNPAETPADQGLDSGLARTLITLSYLLLPLAIVVLLVYVLWFIPVYFQMAFQEREVLIVYNASILGLLSLLTVVVSDAGASEIERRRGLLSWAVLLLWGLTLILNAYALAAMASRILEGNLTPNRLAVIGWNVATLLILCFAGLGVWQHRKQAWLPQVSLMIGRYVLIAALWALMLLAVLPWIG